MGEGDISGSMLEGIDLSSDRGDSLRVSFAAIGPDDGIDVLRLDFRTALFSTGAVLRPSLQQRGASRSAWQRVDAGNAIELGEGNTTTLVGGSDARI